MAALEDSLEVVPLSSLIVTRAPFSGHNIEPREHSGAMGVEPLIIIAPEGSEATARTVAPSFGFGMNGGHEKAVGPKSSSGRSLPAMGSLCIVLPMRYPVIIEPKSAKASGFTFTSTVLSHHAS